jgi:hypothetical protein
MLVRQKVIERPSAARGSGALPDDGSREVEEATGDVMATQ